MQICVILRTKSMKKTWKTYRHSCAILFNPHKSSNKGPKKSLLPLYWNRGPFITWKTFRFLCCSWSLISWIKLQWIWMYSLWWMSYNSKAFIKQDFPASTFDFGDDVLLLPLPKGNNDLWVHKAAVWTNQSIIHILFSNTF